MQTGDDELTDAQLLVRSVDDVELFGELYDRHVADVLGYFVRRTRCGQTAADLTSETFAAAFTSRHRFTDVGAPGRAWLFTIAERQLSRYLRRARVDTRARRRLRVEPLELDSAEIERVEQLVDATQLTGALSDALGQLAPGLAEAVRLRVGAGLPYPEVAQRLGCSEGAARVRVSRGLQRLTLLMGGDT
ncbi:MAG TPA: sigma-70 family RNA polymerase sigma factor [Acidimicrobiales bacterium]